MFDIAKTQGTDNVDRIPGGVGDGFGPQYTVWDANITHGCVCDPGYTGPDCSYRNCPYGDDPRSDHQQDFAFVLTTTNSDAGEDLAGNFYLQIGAIRSEGFNADGSVTTAAVLESVLEDMENIREARVVQGAVDASKGSTWTIALRWAHQLGTNNLCVCSCGTNGACADVG